MYRLFAIACPLLVLSGSPVLSQRLDPALNSTGDLVALCAPDPSTPRINQRLSYCEGFIAGTGMLYREMRDSGVIKPWACAESAPDANAIREKFVAWARSHPEKLDTKPIDGFWQAMAETYPCPASPATKTTRKK